MKKIILMLLLPLNGIAQGIHFEENLSWQQVQAKAKTEHKYIFMDCFATWCVPCKYMAQNVFIQNEVGNQMNEKFISVSVQMDSTAKDNEFIKSWYPDVKKLMNDYQVSSFPTYLFFDPDGHIVHRAGGSVPMNVFIEVAKDAVNPDKEFYPLFNKYEHGNKDSAILRQLTICSVNIGDAELTGKLMSEYIGNVRKIYTKDNLAFISQFTKNSKEEGFKIWLNKRKEVDTVMGEDYAERKVMNVIMNEDRNITAANKKAVEGLKIEATMGDQPIYGAPDKKIKEPTPPDWNNMYKGINKKYGFYYAGRLTNWVKLNYYRQRQDWIAYDQAVIDYVIKFQKTIQPSQLNGYAWDLFTHSDTQKQLLIAASWSKNTVDTSVKDPGLFTYIDTYANLLYKTGNPYKAIGWEKKALESKSEEDKKRFAETLHKMKKGIKTWK